MTVQLELWQLITLLLAFFGAVWVFGKTLFKQTDVRLGERFAAQELLRVDATVRWDKRFDELRNVDRDLLLLRAELPREYMRREDHIRSETVTNAKLDALATRQDLFSERMSVVLAVLKKD